MSKLTVAWNLFPCFKISKVSAISGLSLMSWILSKALSRFNQKLISCKAVPDAGSRSNFVTYTKEMQRKRKKIFLKLTHWTYSWGLNNNNVVIIKCNRYTIWTELVTKLNCACYFVTHPFRGVWGHVPPEYLKNLKLSNKWFAALWDN